MNRMNTNIQFNFICIAPEQYNCLKELHRTQSLCKHNGNTGKKKLPVSQEGTLSRTRAGVGPLFSPGISGPRPDHFFPGSGNWINEATVQLLLFCSFFLLIPWFNKLKRLNNNPLKLRS